MKKAGYNIYKLMRSVLVTAMTAVGGIYVLLYIILSLPSVQEKVRGIGEAELSKLLKTEVSIGKLQISPFNQVVLYDVEVPDQKKNTLLHVDKLGAGISVYNLLAKRRIVFTYAEIIGLDGRINRPDPHSPTNLQFIIDALSPKDKNKPPTKFDIKIHNIVIRKSRLSYDVLSEAPRTDRFDKNHIRVSDLRADVAIPQLKNDDFIIQLKRLSMKEHSGLNLSYMTADAHISKTFIDVKNLRVEMPSSIIAPEDFRLEFSDLKNIGKELYSMPIDLKIANSYITPSDLAAFVPQLKNFNDVLSLTVALRGTLRNLEVPVLSVASGNKRVMLDMKGSVKNMNDVKKLEFNLPHIEVKADAAEIANLTANFAKLTPQVENIITNCGNVHVDGLVRGTLNKMHFSGDVATSLGGIKLNGLFAQDVAARTQSYKGAVSTDGFNIGKLLSKEDLLGMTALDVEVDVKRQPNGILGSGAGAVKYVDLKGYRYSDITADVALKKDQYEGHVKINDDNVKVDVNGILMKEGKLTLVDVAAQVADVSFANLKLTDKYPKHRLSFNLETSLHGENFDDAIGNIIVHDLSFKDDENNGIGLDYFIVESTDNDDTHRSKTVKVSSDVVNGELIGRFDMNHIIPAAKNMLSQPFPAMFSHTDIPSKGRRNINDFTYNVDINIPEDVVAFFKLPVSLLSPLSISGYFNENNQSARFVASAPYILQKKKLIEQTRLAIDINGDEDNVAVTAHSIIPLKKGSLNLDVDMNGVNGRLDTNVAWKVPRETEFSGRVNLSALLGKGVEGSPDILTADVDVNPTKMVFNDTTWQLHPAKVKIIGNEVDVDGFKASCDKQFISIDGKVSKNIDDLLCVELNDINLDYIFETLAIDNVMFGGRGTGKFYASDVYSKMPRLSTPNLHVDGLAYNFAVLGDADIKSQWNSENMAVEIDADIKQPNGYKSKIEGSIFPTMDSLYFEFNTKKVNVKFMKPFMSAFTSDIEGEASGFACLYGNFKRIDLYGDIFADRLKVKLDFTNTYYTASDSIKLRPGNISFKNVKLKDREGHEATLNGWVKHKYFHDAQFNFSVTDAHDFLSYDVKQQPDRNWYGTIYGDGSVFVTGEPGLVNIDVNMRTAANSKFTFVLSDAEVATEYNFITFRDRGKKAKQNDAATDSIPLKVREFQAGNHNEANQGPATTYKINLMAEITPLAQMVLVMDPVGGDRIKAYGSGNVRMTYSNTDDKLTMFGTYTLSKGSYNFTLQDIIVREFAIREGSTIGFNGDPFAAKLDVTAQYQVNANLQDLDESFATDKDMNRTNVPVQALLKVSGDIKEPVIGFDLAFPTLTSEADRKVRSIINTDDMMNRQIIYLLALNRFYTPEYMGATTTRNNELASVASSTISSQLSSMLGQLSENWSISPNFRSDKGDFSDVEVELALSSQLLNNRLLFNGNFGYRDNTMNTRNSNFIGDFDIEYLLTKNGNIRLKAYNHFNDQNYYVKSALTTQGVGVVFKHDFDRLFDFLKKKPRYELNVKDSTIAAPNNRTIETTDSLRR